MRQKANFKLQCQYGDHQEEIETVCYNVFCTESRLSCFQCIKKGIHHAHMMDVEKVNSLIQFLEKINRECDTLIDELEKQLEILNKSFFILTRGIKKKYSLQMERLCHLNTQQVNDFLNSTIKLSDQKQSLTTILVGQMKTLTHSFDNLSEQLQLSSINYYQIDDNDKQLSKELYDKGYKLYLDFKYQEATEQLDKSIQFDNENLLSLTCKGTCLKMLSNYEDAIIYLDKALKIDPQNLDSINQKGSCLQMLKKYQDAIIYFDKAIALDPKNIYSLVSKGRINLFKLIAQCLKMLNKYEDSIIQLDKALAIDFKSIESLSDKGECLRLLKKYDDSLKYLNQALAINPNHTSTLRHKGDCLLDQQHYQEALEYYEKYLNIQSNDVLIKKQLDCCKQQLQK
ncbi:unnamed protein product [Paramecium octaurelia]|uniref:Tetratricopeptide repeat protein n=1 Tax=Paramecium octaurelia TaxID=43137 RepID=A0A8S1YR17_PAROT|nr:unnamed protein product [Paramecium octaurelia]